MEWFSVDGVKCTRARFIGVMRSKTGSTLIKEIYYSSGGKLELKQQEMIFGPNRDQEQELSHTETIC